MFNRPASLAMRVNVFVGATLLTAFFAFGWTIHQSIQNHFLQLDTGELSVVITAIERAIDKPIDPEATNLANAITGHHGVYFAVINPNGTTRYSSDGPDLASALRTISRNSQTQTINPQIWQDRDETYRIAAKPYRDHMIIAAFSMRLHKRFMSEFRITLLMTLMLTSILTLCAAGFAVHRGHLPLRQLSRDIRNITSENLDVRLDPTTVPIELEELVTSFNSALSRFEAEFERLTNFSADLAHEFRTPITNLTTQTQVALSSSRSSEEYQEVLYSSLEEYERLSRMIGDMLLLARTESGLFPLEPTAVKLRGTTLGLFEYFDAWAEERQVKLSCDSKEIEIQADKLMLRRALSNLISNAIRCANQNSEVQVELKQTSDQVMISVINQGQPIAESELARLFDRFYRADSARQYRGEGAGLGLAIVRSIVDAHGGSVSTESNAGNTRFIILLSNTIS